MGDQNSGFIQEVLDIFNCDPYMYSGCYGEIVQYDANGIYRGQYFRDHSDAECNQVENDEIIARTLQEEYSQLAIAEASQYSHAGEDHLQDSVQDQDWHGFSTRTYDSGYECAQDESDDTGPSYSCSSPGDGEEDHYSLELTDEYLPDDEVDKRLNQLIPTRHVPRINGEIPSIDEATSDHERLLNRLQLYDFVELKVQGDGNCQFRALSDQLYNTPENHKCVRRQVVNQLKSHPETYEGYVPMEYGDYLKNMSKSGEWGDHVTLQAAADLRIPFPWDIGTTHSSGRELILEVGKEKLNAMDGQRNFNDIFGLRIIVMTSFKDTHYIEILPNKKSKGVIFLSFWAEVHYNSIYSQGDISSRESRRKKRWWNFGSS